VLDSVWSRLTRYLAHAKAQTTVSNESGNMERRTISPLIFWGGVLVLGWFVLVHNHHDNGAHLNGSSTDEAYETDSSRSLQFHGQSCTVDCSGHEAGYRWAEDHDITDPEDCGGNSQSFIKRCQSYAREHSDIDTDGADGEDSDQQ